MTVRDLFARVAIALIGLTFLVGGIVSVRQGFEARYELIPLHHTPALGILALIAGPVLLTIAIAPRRIR